MTVKPSADKIHIYSSLSALNEAYDTFMKSSEFLAFDESSQEREDLLHEKSRDVKLLEEGYYLDSGKQMLLEYFIHDNKLKQKDFMTESKKQGSKKQKVYTNALCMGRARF